MSHIERISTSTAHLRPREIAGLWLQACLGHERAQHKLAANGIHLTRAAAEFPDQAGGYLVPDLMASSVLSITEKYGMFVQNCDMRTIVSDNLQQPRRTGGVTAYWVPENSVITQSQASLDNVALYPRKLAALVRCSAESMDDADAGGLGQWISNELGLAFAAALDDVFVSGDGSDTYSGQQGLSKLLPSVSTGGVSTFATVTSVEIGNLIGKVEGAALPTAKFYVHPVAYGQMLGRLATAVGGIIMQNGQPTFMGFPVVTSSKMPSSGTVGGTLAYFGALERTAICAQRHSIAVAISRQRLADADALLIRAVQRAHIVVHSTTSMAQLIGAT